MSVSTLRFAHLGFDWRAFACSVVLATASSCSLVFSSSPAAPCELRANGTDPCPSGLHCRGGTCRSDCTTEICNGVDDDCDGAIDNGFDVDRDGFSVCGIMAGGGRGPMDCDDQNPFVHPPGGGLPARSETCTASSNACCDGVDNDCDGVRDVCRSGFLCSLERGACVPDDCTLERNDCGNDTCIYSLSGSGARICDAQERCSKAQGCPDSEDVCLGTGECSYPGSVGDTCSFHEECAVADGLSCVPYFAAGLDHRGRDDQQGFCSKPCARNSDCGTENQDPRRCIFAGTGVGVCVPQSLLEGTAHGDAPDLRACAGKAFCPSIDSCVLGKVSVADRDDVQIFQCQSNATGLEGGSACRQNAECRSGLCHAGTCMRPCARDSDGDSMLQSACNVGDVCRPLALVGGTGSSSHVDWVTVCQSPLGQRIAGSLCSVDEECDSGACLTVSSGERRCLDSCVNDSNCGGGEGCRVVLHRGRYEARCLPAVIL